jgi:hypothetical protein
MSIDRFKAAIVGGGVRPSLFRVRGKIGPESESSNQEFLIKAASLPASTIGLIEFPYKGRKIKVPGDRSFEAWTITVIADGDMEIRKKFESWSSAINNYATNRPGVDDQSFTPSGANNIYQDWIVEQLDRNDNVIHSYKFEECWPASISSIELQWDTPDTYAEFTVEMQYQNFIPEHIRAN